MAYVVLRAEISLSHEDFRRVVRGVRGEALQQQHPSPAEPIMNLWFRLCRAGGARMLVTKAQPLAIAYLVTSVSSLGGRGLHAPFRFTLKTAVGIQTSTAKPLRRKGKQRKTEIKSKT